LGSIILVCDGIFFCCALFFLVRINSGGLRVARGGSGAKAPPLAARPGLPAWGWIMVTPAVFWDTHHQVSKTLLSGSKYRSSRGFGGEQVLRKRKKYCKFLFSPAKKNQIPQRFSGSCVWKKHLGPWPLWRGSVSLVFFGFFFSRGNRSPLPKRGFRPSHHLYKLLSWLHLRVLSHRVVAVRKW